MVKKRKGGGEVAPKSEGGTVLRPGRRDVISGLGLVLATAAAFWSILDNEFVNFDDVFYIVHNPLITEFSAANFKAYFTQYFFGNYHPLTMISLAVDHALAGLQPRMFHATNLLWHLANTLLVYWFLRALLRQADPAKTAGGRDLAVPLVAAALFGLHPLHVESVAWASQRKDMLYTFFYLTSLIAYLGYVGRGDRRYYGVSLLLFVLAVLAKGMAVTLVGTIFAVDILLRRVPWGKSTMAPRPRVGTYVAEKIPLLVLALVFGWAAIQAQAAASFVASTSLHTPVQRVLFACFGFNQYIVKLFLPLQLSAYYPYPELVAGRVPVGFWLQPLATAAVLAALVIALRRWRLIGFGLLVYVLNIAPVLQLVPVGNFIMADRFAYVASLGVLLVPAVLWHDLARRLPRWLPVWRSALVVVLVALGLLTFQRGQVWQDSLTLWNDVLARYPDQWLALNNRGVAKVDLGDIPGAFADYDAALRLKPDYADAYTNRANTKRRTDDFDGAIADYETALRHQPGHRIATTNRIHAFFYRGVARFRAEDYAGAVADFTTVVRANPDYTGVRQNLATARRRLQAQQGDGGG